MLNVHSHNNNLSNGDKTPLVLSPMSSLHATVSLPLFSNSNHKKLTCAATLSPPPWKQSRRVISVSFFLSRLLLLPNGTRISLQIHQSDSQFHELDFQYHQFDFCSFQIWLFICWWWWSDAMAGGLMDKLDKYVKR